MLNRALYILLLLLTPQLLYAQAEGNERIESPGQLWNEALFSHPVNRKWVAKTDLFWSLSSTQASSWQIWQKTINVGIRPGAHYFLKPNIRITPMLGLWLSPEQTELKQKQEIEIRPTLDGQVFKRMDRFTFFLRLRYESRFIKKEEADHFSHNYRIRLMPKAFLAINSKTIRKKTLYVILADELFFTGNTSRWVDQNRITLGAGYCFNNNITLETTYISRLTYQSAPAINHTPILSLSLMVNNFLHKSP